MTARHALIIIVPENKADPSLNLEIVRGDAERLQRSLQHSRYVVTKVGEAGHDAAGGAIRATIGRACSEVPEGGTLLIFYSGHGLHIDGHDYLVPWDADLQLKGFERNLVRIAEVAESVSESKAAQIVFFIDACREGVRPVKSAIRAWGTEKRRQAAQRRYCIVFSCQKAEFSQYVSGTAGFSLFSRAVADVLAPDNPARTLKEIAEATQRRVDELAKEYNKQEPKQRLSVVSESDVDFDPGDMLLCDGYKLSAEASAAKNWEDAVFRSPLWRRFYVDGGPTALFEPFRDAAASLAARAEAQCRASAGALGDDPWRDDLYPIRIVDRLEELTSAGGQLDLNPAEVALLLTAPFVREQAYAAAVGQLAQVRPADLDVDPATLPEPLRELRRRLAITFRSHERLTSRVERLYQSTTKRDPALRSGRGIMLWLMHRHLSRFAPMWHKPPDGTLPQEIGVRLSGGPEADASGEVVATLTGARLLKLAKCVRSELDRLRRRDGPNPLEASVRAVRDGQSIRERLLGALLCLAGWMALDVRAAGEVLVDHIGLGDPLDPLEFTRTAASAKWAQVGSTLRLRIECPHPAMDFALSELVVDADRILTGVSEIIAIDEGLADAAKSLPAALSTDDIRPTIGENGPSYTTPHQRFTLAQNEVRELLMGAELYGSPDLAIREIYQNALDACRYRRARHDYLARRGRRSDWTPKIIFRQGEIEGRPYVECEDNGVGMGSYELDQCFARAGKRFADLPEFVEEQELWLQCEPPIRMTPNSQFGVGVFSYFMIADEIDVTTCRLDRDGHLLPALHVQIPAAGGLFRVQSVRSATDAGTRVRLYLRQDWQKSARKILEDLLVVAEFDTEASDPSGRTAWRPNEPRVEALQPENRPSLIPKGQRLAATDDPDFWWDGERDSGQVLADGIKTAFGAGIKFPLRSGHQPRAALVNFHGQRRPKLTIDRKSILECDAVWLNDTYGRQASVIATAPWRRLTWLHELQSPGRWDSVAKQILDSIEQKLFESDCYVPIGYMEELVPSYSPEGEKSTIRQLGVLNTVLPLKVIPFGADIAKAVRLLAGAGGAMSDRERLSLLHQFSDLHYPQFADVPEAWEALAADSLSRDVERIKKDPIIYLLAIFNALGIPVAAWLHPYLPDIDIEKIRATPPPTISLPELQPAPKRPGMLQRGLSAVGDWINSLPDPVVISGFVVGIGILGHFVIVGLEVGWTYVAEYFAF